MTTFKYKNKRAIISIEAEDENKSKELLDGIIKDLPITDKNFKLVKNDTEKTMDHGV